MTSLQSSSSSWTTIGAIIESSTFQWYLSTGSKLVFGITSHCGRQSICPSSLGSTPGGHSGGSGRHLPVASEAPPWHMPMPPPSPGSPSEYSQ